MYQSIGEVYLQTISKINAEPSSQTVNQAHTINQPFPIAIPEKKRLREIEIRGYVFNDGKKTRKEYTSDLDALTGRYSCYNRIQMEDIDGYAEVRGTEIRNAAEQLNTYLIYAVILPRNEYNCLYQYKQVVIPQTHTSLMPSYIVLPFGVTSMDVTNRSREVLRKNKKCDIVTPEGSLPVFELPDILNTGDATKIADDVDNDNTFEYISSKLDLNTDYLRWTITPGVNRYSGKVKFTAYARIYNSSTENITITVRDDDDVTVLEQTFTTTSLAWVELTTNAIALERYKQYTVTVNKTGAGEVYIAGLRTSEVEDVKHIRFDIPAPNMDKGECKVYDTVTVNQTDKTKWKRVYAPASYKFTGQIVIENATMQWKINPNAYWKNTGIFTDRISNATGTLYPDEFKEMVVDISIINIKPDDVILEIQLRDFVDKLKVVIVHITPLTMYFKVTPRISYADAIDWRLVIPSNTSIGTLNDVTKSMAIFTATSSITMIHNKPIGTMFVTNGICSYNIAEMNEPYVFAISVLPRVTDNTGKLYNNKFVSGADYYVDGEFVDLGKTLYLSDFINSLYQNGLMVNMRIAHKMYGDEKWT